MEMMPTPPKTMWWTTIHLSRPSQMMVALLDYDDGNDDDKIDYSDDWKLIPSMNTFPLSSMMNWWV